MGAFVSRYGVPIRGVRGGGMEDGGVLQPKLKHRFRVLTTGFGYNALSQENISRNVQSVTRPQIQFDEIEVHSFNSIAYIPGKHRWQPATLITRDEINSDISLLVNGQKQKQVDMINQTAGTHAGDYKFKMQVSALDGIGNPLETWTYLGCWIQADEEDTPDYQASEFLQSTVTIRFDNAFLGKGAFEGFPDELALADLTPEVYANFAEGRGGGRGVRR